MGLIHDRWAAYKAAQSGTSAGAVMARFETYQVLQDTFEVTDADPIRVQTLQATDAGFIPDDEPGVNGGSGAGKYRVLAPSDGLYEVEAIIQSNSAITGSDVEAQVDCVSSLANPTSVLTSLHESTHRQSATASVTYQLAEGDSVQVYIYPMQYGALTSAELTIKGSMRKVGPLPTFL